MAYCQEFIMTVSHSIVCHVAPGLDRTPIQKLSEGMRSVTEEWCIQKVPTNGVRSAIAQVVHRQFAEQLYGSSVLYDICIM